MCFKIAKYVNMSKILLSSSLVIGIVMTASAVFDNNADKGDTLHSKIIITDSIVQESSIFQSLDYLTKDDLYLLIDSLLDQEQIPSSLIKEIELVVEAKYKELPFYTFSPTREYPADKYYKSWDTYNTHPYSNKLSQNDESLELVLEDSLRSFVYPKKGPITSYFGDGRNHNGLDIDLEVWDTVVSSFDGVVRIARHHGGYGRVVVVRHFNGLETLYAHLHRIKVKSGETVKAGQLVGLGGSSGKSTGSHLHFECRFKGKPLNPTHFIDTKHNILINDTVVLKKTKWSYSVVPKGIKYHSVQKGEFLYLIAKQYGTTITQLCKLNGLSRNGILRVGQKLRIG